MAYIKNNLKSYNARYYVSRVDNYEQDREYSQFTFTVHVNRR